MFGKLLHAASSELTHHAHHESPPPAHHGAHTRDADPAAAPAPVPASPAVDTAAAPAPVDAPTSTTPPPQQVWLRCCVGNPRPRPRAAGC